MCLYKGSLYLLVMVTFESPDVVKGIKGAFRKVPFMPRRYRLLILTILQAGEQE